MKAPVNRIIPFSNVDGPGNRFAIFLQRCPFSCLYCHNPETINDCITCGDCIVTCPVSALAKVEGKILWDKEKCVQCDTCLKTCTHCSTPKIEWLSVEAIMKQVDEVKPFIRGLTVSGGECTEHPEFLLELFKEAQLRGLTCLLDSNGFYDFKNYPDLLEVCDGVMLDVKAWDDEFHQRITHQSNKMVLNNLDYLLEINKLQEVRTVILPQFKEQNELTVRKVAEILQGKCLYKLLRYRPFGVRKEGLDFFGEIIVSQQEVEELALLARKEIINQVKVI